jgi:hypothetical protein
MMLSRVESYDLLTPTANDTLKRSAAAAHRSALCGEPLCSAASQAFLYAQSPAVTVWSTCEALPSPRTHQFLTILGHRLIDLFYVLQFLFCLFCVSDAVPMQAVHVLEHVGGGRLLRVRGAQRRAAAANEAP